MRKVITYGTFDLLHYGHINLLKRCKELGDYLVVAVTGDDYDRQRGKINAQQSLMERIESIRLTGLADEIIVEEYEGQKIDDIKRYNIDVFAIGSDWINKFDYLNEFCEVIYLERTKGVSSSDIRSEKRKLKVGLLGNSSLFSKFKKECDFVNGIEVHGICTDEKKICTDLSDISFVTTSFDELIDESDSIYIMTPPSEHYIQIKKALKRKKHVMCESPICLKKSECEELIRLAKRNGCVLMESLKTAYTTAFYRLCLLSKGGIIGKIISVDATCTSLKTNDYYKDDNKEKWNSFCEWGPLALLPIFELLGTHYIEKKVISSFANFDKRLDNFTKCDFIYSDAVASLKVGKGVKSEGQLVISGTKGYIYVPAPWWKTEYFEVRFENQENNKRYFYQLEGEGIRYQIIAFLKSIETTKDYSYINQEVTVSIVAEMEDFFALRNHFVLDI